MTNTFKTGNLRISTPFEWLDITHEIDQPDPPFSLARPEGVGAIQFSVAQFQGGKLPEITIDALTDLLVDFGQSRELGRSFGAYRQEKALLISAASFEADGRFWRVWYCSDGRSVSLVTYNCVKGQEQAELADCEGIIRNLKFGT